MTGGLGSEREVGRDLGGGRRWRESCGGNDWCQAREVEWGMGEIGSSARKNQIDFVRSLSELNQKANFTI